ncbi:uncharacterized protein LOC115887551 [Sitophilus oryzae]|uniref:pectinesterase n=1 Tax=Sitophilus oryzae TaxID=7048 RepID=A0A6J2YHX0_SITOR|nr:uncharacterized protein LOC115887551 [Sitophilus oryzae]
MGRNANIFVVFALIAVSLKWTGADHQEYPGTETRPVLSDSEASRYTQETVFGDWGPQLIVVPDVPDYTVKVGESIQKVVNQAFLDGGVDRKFIKIEPGTYEEFVYIKGDVPLTIYGGGNSAEDVIIVQNISASIQAEGYVNLVNPNGERYQEGDSAWDIYNGCATKSGNLGSCATVLWIENDEFMMTLVTVQNTAVDVQGIAVQVDADKINLMFNRYLAAQNTLYLGAHPEQRIHIHGSYVEGQTDIIVGQGAAEIHLSTVKVIGNENIEHPVIFAPSTPATQTFGFLVYNSTLTGDASYLGSNKVYLGRAWDSGIEKSDDYVPGVSPNGQLVIKASQIDAITNVEQPYAPTSTSGRLFSTDLKEDRDLDDNTHNRFWEYKNYGDNA